MSGTSLDGLDICYASFNKTENWHFEIIAAETIPYETDWEEKLKNAFSLSAEEIFALNSEYGFYLGEKVNEFINRNSLTEIDVIASHGHTIFHQPERKFTTQIGDGRAIKITTNLPVAYDFRSQDVLLGGNGAPFVPIGDELLFSEYDACINLGGFSNISFKTKNTRVAFDICPVNIVLNKLATEFGKKYDKNGDLARKFNPDENLLAELKSIDFYQKKYPKSLGQEWVNENIEPLLKDIHAETALATFTRHAAQQIAEVLIKFNLKNVLFTGGGTYNKFLIEEIERLSGFKFILPDSKIIEFKEALIFAFMGILRLRNENNVLSSATGCAYDHCSGILV